MACRGRAEPQQAVGLPRAGCIIAGSSRGGTHDDRTRMPGVRETDGRGARHGTPGAVPVRRRCAFGAAHGGRTARRPYGGDRRGRGLRPAAHPAVRDADGPHRGGRGQGRGRGPRSGSSGTWEGAASGTREGSASWTGTPEPDAAGAAGAVGADRAAGAVGAAIDPGAAATTMPLFPGGDGPDAGVGVGSPGGATHPVPDGSRRRTATAGPAFDPDPVRPRRRRPFGALAVGAAVAAVVGTAAFAAWAVRRRRQYGRGAAGGHHERPGHRGRTGRVGGPVPLRVSQSAP